MPIYTAAQPATWIKHMKRISIFTTAVLFAVITAASGLAKDKDKDKDRDRDNRDRDRYDDRGDRYHDDRDRGGRYGYSDRTRTIYVIERDRPVERVVYIDREGSYYRVVDGRRIYIRDRYFDSYPSKYYYPDGRRRVTITLPF